MLFLRAKPEGQAFLARNSSTSTASAKALSILAHKLGRAVYLHARAQAPCST